MTKSFTRTPPFTVPRGPATRGDGNERLRTMTKSQARERVARGAAFLDQARPGWAHEIDPGLLDLSDSCYCVLGQLIGDYEASKVFPLPKGVGEIDDADIGFHILHYDDLSHPFLCECAECLSNWTTLQNAWIDAIADRVIPQTMGEPVASPRVAGLVTTVNGDSA